MLEVKAQLGWQAITGFSRVREKKRVRSQRTQKQRRKFKSKKRKKKKKVKLLNSGFRMGDYYQVAIVGDWSII